jgi:hypothetical protein
MKDEHEGKGGSYSRDPRTGKVTLLERTEEPSVDAAEKPADTATETKPNAGKE